MAWFLSRFPPSGERPPESGADKPTKKILAGRKPPSEIPLQSAPDAEQITDPGDSAQWESDFTARIRQQRLRGAAWKALQGADVQPPEEIPPASGEL